MSGTSDLLDLVDDLDAVVFEADARTFRFTFVNRRAEVLLGYPVRQWLEEPDFWANHIHPEDRDTAVSFCRGATAAGEDHVFEYRFVAASGDIRWLRDTVRVALDPDGRPARLRGVMVDITERKRTEQALHEKESRLLEGERLYRALIENSTDLVSILEPTGAVRYASASHERILGWRPEELVGRDAFELVHPDDLAGLAQVFGEGMQTPGTVATHEFRYRTRDGGWRTLEGRAMNLIDDPAIRGAVINLRDVTQRTEAERELRRRLAVEEIVADASSTLAAAATGELGGALYRVLESIAAYLGADRVFIALFSHGRGTWHVRHEWVADGVAPMGPALQNVPRDRFDWMISQLEERGWAEAIATGTLPPPESEELSFMQAFGVRSGRSARMTARGRFDGFLLWTYGAEATPRPLDDDLNLVRFVGEICANAIARQQEEDTRAALLDLSRRFGGMLDSSSLLDQVQPRIATLLDCDMVSTYLGAGEDTPFELVASHGVPKDLEHPRRSSMAPGHPIHDILATGAIAVVNDVSAQQWFPPATLDAYGIDHFLLAPIALHGRLRGALATARRRATRPFDTNEVDLLDGIARQISLVLQSAELYREQQTEALVGSALARAGREVISSLDQPVLLDRLSQLTTDLIGCEFSHTYLWDAKEQAFAAVAWHGEPPERTETLRVLRIPVSLVADLHEQLGREDVVEIAAPRDERERMVAAASGVSSVVYVALRRGDEIVGALAAGWRSRTQVFTREQIRIARGLGQLASLALANARMVEEIERLSRLKSDFVATMSHELRTPLNVILGYSDLLQEGAFSPLTPEQREVIARLHRSGAELLELVNATLDVSRIESGRIAAEHVVVDPSHITAEVRQEMRGVEPPAGVTLEWDIAADLPPLTTDPVKVKVVLKNLIGNALKFTLRGSVRIAARARDGGVEIAVIDTGIGISAEGQAVIFEAFRQLDSSSTRRHGGVGLGLYITRRLLDLIGGRISLESVPGAGSTFRVWLPVGPEAAAARHLPAP